MNADTIVAALAQVRMANVFNPYADVCPVHDLADAPQVRQANLRAMLYAAHKLQVDTIWMGRDLGHRGGRRTGLALTDEAHLQQLAKCFGGLQIMQATMGMALRERTAAEIWAAIVHLPLPPFLWNVFPLHPHEVGSPFSNRRFTSRELNAVDAINQTIINWLGIRRIVAIGQDAARYSKDLGVEVLTIRHPSYGGTADFRVGISSIYPQANFGLRQRIMF